MTILLSMLRLATLKVLTFGSNVVQDPSIVFKKHSQISGVHLLKWETMLLLVFIIKSGVPMNIHVLLKDFHLAYLHSHLVCAVKFLMSPKDYKVSGNSSVYELSDHTLTSIQSVIATLEED